MEKLVFGPFSWVIYLLLRYYEPLNFLVYKSAPRRLPKELFVSSARRQCLVLLSYTFSQKFTDFHQDEFSHFWTLLKRKGQPGKKS